MRASVSQQQRHKHFLIDLEKLWTFGFVSFNAFWFWLKS